MPGTYGTHTLPLILGSDRPCDAATTLCALRDRINVFLADYQDTVDTVVNAVPAAKLSRPFGAASSPFNDPPNPEGNILIPFTTVEFDNANMTNLSANSTVITLPREGRYVMNAYIRISQRAGSTVFDQETISFEGGFFNSSTPMNTCTVKPTGGTNPATAISISDIRGGFQGDEIAVRLNPNLSAGTAPAVILDCMFAVYWITDFEV